MNRYGNNICLSKESYIGNNVVIGNNVTIYPCVHIGDNCTILDGAVIGRVPQSTINSNRNIVASPRLTRIGSGSIIGSNAVLYTGITIGNRVLIGDLASIREDCYLDHDAVIGRNVMIMYQVVLGERTRVIDGAILTGNMLIENDVFIGPGVISINDDDVYLKRYGIVAFNLNGPIIRRFALIGAGANLSSGIEIGTGAIVAPSAMVTKSVPEWTIVAGVPARMVREVDTISKQRLLEHFNLTDSNTI